MAEVDLGKYLRLVWKWLWLMVLCVLIGSGASYIASKSMQPTYRTSLVLMVGETLANPTVRTDDILTSQRLAAAYAGLATSQPVLEATVQSLGLEGTWRDLRTNVLVVQTEASQLIEIRVTASNPQQAKDIADEVARQVERNSPTADYTKQLEQRRQFVEQQLDDLQNNIKQAEVEVAGKKAQLETEISARGVMDRQDEIRALELKISNWRTTYGALLASYQGRSPSTITVIEPPFVPTVPISPNVNANVLMAAALGLLLALAAAFLIEYLSDSVSTAEDAERLLGLPLVGAIPRLLEGTQSGAALVSLQAPLSAPAEAYRVLCTNLRFALLDNASPTLLVTSPGPCEGKTTTAVNLATSFAHSGMRTILVDADLRKPALHELFFVGNESGLTSLLIPPPIRALGEPNANRGNRALGDERDKDADLEQRVKDYLVQTENPDLFLLPSGPRPAHIARVLSASRMEQVLRALHSVADVVVLDSPPVLPVADTAILAAKTTGVVIVMHAGRTRRRSFFLAKKALVKARAQVLGVVLNGVARRDIHQYAYQYELEQPKRSRLHSARSALASLFDGLRGRLATAGEKASLMAAQGRWTPGVRHAEARVADVLEKWTPVSPTPLLQHRRDDDLVRRRQGSLDDGNQFLQVPEIPEPPGTVKPVS
ncbi:MAG: tyrosine-protein kinase domain-containing protein [Chloroflexota bacterium]